VIRLSQYDVLPNYTAVYKNVGNTIAQLAVAVIDQAVNSIWNGI